LRGPEGLLERGLLVREIGIRVRRRYDRQAQPHPHLQGAMNRATPGFGALGSFLIAVLAVLVLSACGGGSDSSTTAPSGESSAAPPSAEEEVEEAGREAQGSEAEEILSAKREYLTAIGDK